ncbi:Similar to S.cerevisiae protein YFH1 (Mitochondrial matrix iron chaperone) [Malassezia sympodialis ATCC 42132]|uniref:ferroxidase n=1 Tax=Malassezia sympodialis (strain ATCC 42132) TaxID=1230383 RepID=A0A1M8ABI0_MALS4|nr:Similar to S.cerevisiae protein YFH1 (Mitochondrial matrix iron chaperone) [Malassezia sympodialis ATCC 42132]
MSARLAVRVAWTSVRASASIAQYGRWQKPVFTSSPAAWRAYVAAPPPGQRPEPTPLEMTVYHRMVDHTLDELTAQLEELLETKDLDALEEGRGGSMSDWDVEYASGVLNLRLGSYGTYVINKQPPTRQIWLSSPSSGPKRFDYDGTQQRWFTIKDGELFYFDELLTKELSDVFQTTLDLALDVPSTQAPP